MKNKVKAILLVVLLAISMTACTEVAETHDEPAPYANLKEMEDLNYSYSISAWGNKFGKINLDLKWETERYQWAEFEECYLEYSIDEFGEYQRVIPRQETDDALVEEDVDILGNQEKLMPFEKRKLVADVDSYYDYCNLGWYRLAIVFKIKPYSGKTKEAVAYVGIGGDDGTE